MTKTAETVLPILLAAGLSVAVFPVSNFGLLLAGGCALVGCAIFVARAMHSEAVLRREDATQKGQGND